MSHMWPVGRFCLGAAGKTERRVRLVKGYLEYDMTETVRNHVVLFCL